MSSLLAKRAEKLTMTHLFFENVSETITYSGSGWMLANIFHQGFFRTLYDDDTNDEILSQLKTNHTVGFSTILTTKMRPWKLFTSSLKGYSHKIFNKWNSNFKVFPVENRGQIIDDAFNLARSVSNLHLMSYILMWCRKYSEMMNF